MSAARWEDGEPLNVEAAIADALEWLARLTSHVPQEEHAGDAEALDGAIRALARYGDAETQAEYAPEPAAPGREEK